MTPLHQQRKYFSQLRFPVYSQTEAWKEKASLLFKIHLFASFMLLQYWCIWSLLPEGLLSYLSPYVFIVQIKRLHLLLTVKESAMDVPSNLEARRRLTFFSNSLFMEMP